MVRARWVFNATMILMIVFGALALQGENGAAQAPARRATIVVSYTEYEWWMLRWDDNSILCRILVDHEGLPTGEEVLKYCGGDTYVEWQQTPPCKKIAKGGSPASCEGVYLFLVSSQPKQREVVVDLPVPTVKVNLEGCSPSPPDSFCPQIPSLLLTAEEPLPNEEILEIRGTLEGQAFSCPGARCVLPLRATPRQGVAVEFWARSSYGDESEHFTARVRVIDSGVSPQPGGTGWYVDVISSQWQGAPTASCARIWQAFPPAGAPPRWLSSPTQKESLSTFQPYYYLAGRLIAEDVVDASACSTGGLLPNGYADACGLEKARPEVEKWQNQFDARILDVSKETGIPAQLMKNLFAQESQFWPGMFRVRYEFGLGQITDKGADAILLWNKSFFAQFCPLVLAEDACAGGYLKLKAEDQALLRGALAVQARADCAGCPAGIDLTNVDFNMALFGQTLQANCEQVAQIVFNATDEMPGALSTYEDLWRFTIANYHAGPGCVSYAIFTTFQSGDELTWEAVAPRFTEPCKGVVPYVDKITR